MTKIYSVGKVLLLILFSTHIYATTGSKNKKKHGSKHSCNCKRELTLSGGLYDSSEYVFWGKVVNRSPLKIGFSHKVKLQKKVKGCFNFKEDFIFLSSDPKCPVKLKLHQQYIIAIRKRKGKHKHILISNCSYIHKQVDDISSWAGGGISELAWLGSQMGGGCKKQISCADGSHPLICNKCPIEDIQIICPIAKTCKMNQCNGCRPQFFDDSGKRVCDSCPPDQPPIPCPIGLCTQAKPPASCNSESDLFCIPWGCGSCSTLWINKFGKQVCKNQSISHQCSDISTVNLLGKCPKKKLGYGMISGTCRPIKGCKKKLNDISLFTSEDMCQKVCLNPNRPYLQSSNKPPFRVHDKSSFDHSSPPQLPIHVSYLDPDLQLIPDISTLPDVEVEIIDYSEGLDCPDGQTADKCVTKNLEMYCQFVKCKGHQPKQCRADPCNKCRVELEDSTGQIINPELCKLDLPAYRECTAFAKVTCPSTTKEKHIYIKKDLEECVGIVPQKCMLIKQSQDGNFEYYYDTISNFTFTPGYNYELLIKEISILNPPADGSSLKWELIRIVRKIKKDFIFEKSQEIKIGGDRDEHNCIGSAGYTWCPFKKKCIRIWEEECIDCGPIPSSCPPDWNARCVIDPCSCKPIWMNEDIRSPSDECLRSLVAECVPEEECPMEFECLPPKKKVKERHDFPQGYDLQCIQEPCTCVPMWHTYDTHVGPLVVPGFKEKCQDGQRCCQPGNYNAKNCSIVRKYNEELCGLMECEVEVNLDSCTTDVCDDCNIKAKSITNEAIDMGTCVFIKTLEEECHFDDTIKCDPNIPLECGPFPPSCPEDWNINCVLDPCVCRPYWRDMDVRYTKETCKMALEPPCIPYEECPKLPCNNLTPELEKDFECRPVHCTCQPKIYPITEDSSHLHKYEGHSHSRSGKGRGHSHLRSGKGRGHSGVRH